MRVALERDGRTTWVEVSDDLTSATVDGRTFPVSVLATSAERVELEVAGERVVVEGWPEHFPAPPGPVDVDGERWTVGVHLGSAPPSTAPARPVARPEPSEPAAAGVPPAEGGAVPVVPPMPGRVIEVRVREGARVEKGTVLLVLEAMKMRNEIPSPVAGVVQGLRVKAGANARAKEPMLFVVPSA